MQQLTAAWGQGRISRDEYSERVNLTMSATYVDEVAAQLNDLGGSTSFELAVPTDGELVRDSWQSEPEHLPARMVAADTPGSALSVAFMSGTEKTGPWVVPATHVSLGFWGGTTIDLREAQFTSAETTITCIAVMGGVEVIVPPDMDVRVTGIGVMGGFGWGGRRRTRLPSATSPGGPVVTVNGLGFWGGVEVVRRDYGEELQD